MSNQGFLSIPCLNRFLDVLNLQIFEGSNMEFMYLICDHLKLLMHLQKVILFKNMNKYKRFSSSCLHARTLLWESMVEELVPLTLTIILVTYVEMNFSVGLWMISHTSPPQLQLLELLKKLMCFLSRNVIKQAFIWV